jgi:MerR family transcriptional regulator, redox-sensitive transcriptional activator SoxR
VRFVAGGITIGEVAAKAGIRPSALRYYESVEILPKPERVNGRRRYDGEVLREVLDRLAMVGIAQQAGFTVAEIRTLLQGFSDDAPPSERWQVLARDKLTELEVLIERAKGMKRVLERGLGCECLSIEDCALLVEERRRVDAVGVHGTASSSTP